MRARGEILYGDEMNPLAQSDYQISAKKEKINRSRTCEIGLFQDEHETEKEQ